MYTDNFAPVHARERVCEPGDFIFAAAALDHGHINGMCGSLAAAGGVLKYVYDADIRRAGALASRFPGAVAVSDLQIILEDKEIALVAAAAITSQRAGLGIRVMEAGKDYFTDKAPLTTLAQLDAVKAAIARTNRKYFVYYSERLASECSVYAGQLIDAGVIGRVISVDGLGPHRLGAGRPDWFFRRAEYGGILCDIGSHQIEQFLHFTGESDADVTFARTANFNNPAHPEFEDFGEACLTGANGAASHFRVDWFTPDGLGTWGDGRVIILGTKGYIELRKFIDVARERAGNQIYLVDGTGEYHLNATGKTGFPYFGELILDCLNRTENAMTQAHALRAAELCVRAQMRAEESGNI